MSGLSVFPSPSQSILVSIPLSSCFSVVVVLLPLLHSCVSAAQSGALDDLSFNPGSGWVMIGTGSDFTTTPLPHAVIYERDRGRERERGGFNVSIKINSLLYSFGF